MTTRKDFTLRQMLTHDGFHVWCSLFLSSPFLWQEAFVRCQNEKASWHITCVRCNDACHCYRQHREAKVQEVGSNNCWFGGACIKRGPVLDQDRVCAFTYWPLPCLRMVVCTNTTFPFKWILVFLIGGIHCYCGSMISYTTMESRYWEEHEW